MSSRVNMVSVYALFTGRANHPETKGLVVDHLVFVRAERLLHRFCFLLRLRFGHRSTSKRDWFRRSRRVGPPEDCGLLDELALTRLPEELLNPVPTLGREDVVELREIFVRLTQVDVERPLELVARRLLFHDQHRPPDAGAWARCH